MLASLAPVRGNSAPPAAPAGFVQDGGRTLLPHRAAALSVHLQAAAQTRGLRIYVVTVASLGVPPSQQEERLAKLARLYVQQWLADGLGVVLLADDESGKAIVSANAETNRRFPPFQRNQLLQEPLHFVQREGLLRDKIEGTARLLVEVLSQMQDEEAKAVRRDHRVILGMAAITLGGVALLVFSKTRRRAR